MTKRFTADDPDLAEMQQMAGDIAALGTNDKIHLHFALGKALADKRYSQRLAVAGSTRHDQHREPPQDRAAMAQDR